MANTITKQTIVDGQRNLVVKAHIVGDGSGDETNTSLVDVSSFAGSPSTVKIKRITGSLTGFSMQLHWDATANVDIVNIPASDDLNQDYTRFGGLVNNAGAGVTGDILFSTAGLGSGDEGTLILEMQKS